MAHPPPIALPAAVSPLVAHRLEGPSRPARVLGAFPNALYLSTGVHEEVVPVLARDAVHLPTGLLLARSAAELRWGVETGDMVRVGERRIRLPGRDVVVVRTRQVPRVPWGDASPAAYPHVLAHTDVSPILRALAEDVTREALVGSPSSLETVVGGLVGAGHGLTPSGDDALCGVLLGLRAAGAVRAHRRLADAVRALTPATTSLSASLLLAAIEGYAVPDVVRLVTLLASSSTDRHEAAVRARSSALPGCCPSVAPEVEITMGRVLAIGHSSGADLVAGLTGALEALHDHASNHPDFSTNEEGARRA